MQLAQRGFGENLTHWFRLMGRQWKSLLMCSLVAFVPAAVLTVVIFLVAGAGETFTKLLDDEYINSLTRDEFFELFVPFLWATGLWVVLLIVPSVFVYLAASSITATDYNGGTADWRVAGREALSRLGRAVVAGLVLGLGMLALMAVVGLIGWALISSIGAEAFPVFLTTVLALTSLVFVIWLSLSLSLYAQAIGFNDLGVIESLTRSFSLVRGRWWPTFGFLAVTGLIASAASSLLSAILVPFFILSAFAPSVLAVTYGLITLIQAPVAAAVAAAYSLWYLDLWAGREMVMTEDLIKPNS